MGETDGAPKALQAGCGAQARLHVGGEWAAHKKLPPDHGGK